MEKFYIENKSHSDINNDLKNDFKNYESKQKDYGEELKDLGHSHLKKYQSKINDAVKKIEGIQPVDRSKFSEQYNNLEKKLRDAKNEIDNKTTKLNLGYIAYKKHHNEHINALGAAIDHYENEALNTIDNLIDAINDDEQIQGEKNDVDNANKKRNYVEINDDGIYRLTKNTNKPRIDQVLSTVIKEGELRKIDYSGCTNQSIKNRMAETISRNSRYGQASSNRFSCYLQYDSKRNTYLISDGQGNILPQRALIWEGVQLTPPSKIKGEAKLAQTEQQKAVAQEANRTDLKESEKQQLKDSMPQKLKDAIPNEYLDEFFSKTEKDINNRIQNAKYLGYELAAQPISKVGHTKNGKLLQIHLINGQSETKENLITTQLSEPLFKALDSHETELVQYMTMRVVTKWGKFDYLTKRDSVTTHRETNDGIKISEEQKDFTSYGLGLLSQWADNVFNKIGNTNNKSDRKFTSLKKYINDSLYTLENSDNVTKDDLNDILKKLCELMPINVNDINNLLGNILGIKADWASLENCKDINERQQKHQELQSSAKSIAIDSMRKLGNSRTLFDNADTAFLRDEIISDVNGENVDIENDDYEKYFKKIYELYSLPEPNLTEGEQFDPDKIIDSKKSEIDELYKNAQSNEDKFLNFLINKGLLPNTHDKKLKEKVKELKTSLNQQEKAAENFEITGNELRNRFQSEQSKLQLKSSLNDEERKRLNELDFILAQDSNFFDSIAKEETEKTKKIITYIGIESTIKAKIAPYLIQKGGGIKGINNSDIYNDSVGAGGWFERSDENCAKIGPVLKEIIIEVLITAVSIALSWNGAGEAIYGAFRAAKLVAQTAKGMQKVIKFMAAFSKALAKSIATQYAGKFTAKAAKAAKSIGNISKISLSTVVKGGETFGSLATKLAMKGTSMIIEGTTFHISNTIIQNAVRGNRLSDGLDPSGYTEGPDGEKIPNRRNYAQSIAFLGVLKMLGKPIGNLSGKVAKGILKTEYPASTAEKMLSNSLSIAGEMGSMMGTDQILSLSFDQKFKSVTAEDLITMFGMVAGLRLTNKVNMKFQQYDRKSVTIEMKKGGNTFNVKIDREGNVLKIDGKDNTGRKISNPGNELGIKSWDGNDAQNLRETHNGQEVGTVKGDIKQLNNLHEGDIITVKHGENDIKFKKNKSGNRKIVDSGNITNERFNTGEEFVVKKNADGSGFHLESKFEGGPKIALDGKVRVKLGDRSSTIVEGNNGITAQISENNDGVTNHVEDNKTAEDVVKNKAVEELYDRFDREIMSKDGITIDGITYKLERRPNEGHNPNRKGRVVYTETGPDGKVLYKAEAHSNTFVLPENSNGNNIRNRFNAAREKYVNKNLNSALEPARQELDSEVSKDIDSRAKDLEGKRKDKETLELNKKSLSDEIDGLKSRKAQLEQQLQNISKELTQQADIVSLNDIYSIIKPTNKISIGGKKMTFVGVKGNKIVFTEGKGKTREFSSFKELQDAGANFNIDIKSRQGEKGLEQQILFEELVSKEARTSSANEIIKKYEELQRQKVQIENDIRDGYFRENAAKLKGKHIWIDGVEYQCTDIKTNNGRTTLDFKKTDGNEHFTISSFEQLKAKGQVNGFGDRYDVKDKESKAAGRELSQYERENHDLLRGENGLFKGQNKYVENKRQELQQINQQLENGKNDYNSAVQANRPRTVTNPEYERILKEIEGIDAQLIEKGQKLAGIERDLGASDTEIARLEQEIKELETKKDILYIDEDNLKIGGFFSIEGINSIETLKEKGDLLYFEKNKRTQFKNALLDGNFDLAKQLYIEAFNLTKNKLERIGITPEQNKFIVECFRKRDYEGIKKILNETKDVVGKNMQVEDTEHKYSKKVVDKETGKERIEYDNVNKTTYKDPITEKEVTLTRRELHERIIEKFLLDGEASKGKKELILSGGLPGAGKSTIEKALADIPKVIVNPDLVKDYLPEYYDEHGRKFGAEIVHEESSYLSKIIYDKAIEGGYSILYDSSMKDKPSEGFPKYNKIVDTAHKQGYKIEARFIYDGGESRYRNSVLRERSMGLGNYNAYGTAYKTIEYLSKDSRVQKIIIYDNSSINRKPSDGRPKIVYENQEINIIESDNGLIKRFNEYQLFLDKLL